MAKAADVEAKLPDLSRQRRHESRMEEISSRAECGVVGISAFPTSWTLRRGEGMSRSSWMQSSRGCWRMTVQRWTLHSQHGGTEEKRAECDAQTKDKPKTKTKTLSFECSTMPMGAKS